MTGCCKQQSQPRLPNRPSSRSAGRCQGRRQPARGARAPLTAVGAKATRITYRALFNPPPVSCFTGATPPRAETSPEATPVWSTEHTAAKPALPPSARAWRLRHSCSAKCNDDAPVHRLGSIASHSVWECAWRKPESSSRERRR